MIFVEGVMPLIKLTMQTTTTPVEASSVEPCEVVEYRNRFIVSAIVREIPWFNHYVSEMPRKYDAPLYGWYRQYFLRDASFFLPYPIDSSGANWNMRRHYNKGGRNNEVIATFGFPVAYNEPNAYMVLTNLKELPDFVKAIKEEVCKNGLCGK